MTSKKRENVVRKIGKEKAETGGFHLCSIEMGETYYYDPVSHVFRFNVVSQQFTSYDAAYQALISYGLVGKASVRGSYGLRK